MEQQYDFFSYGSKVARDNQLNIERLENEIEQRYGKDARDKLHQGYTVTMQSILSSARHSVEEIIALEQADQIDEKVANNLYNEEVKRNGMM